jgi:hypothetical protein
MACSGCARRKRKLMVGVARVLTAIGRPIPRRALDVMTGVRCNACLFKAEGVGFQWDEMNERGVCPKCGSWDLALGTARLM